MLFKEAKEYLNNRGYILEEAYDYYEKFDTEIRLIKVDQNQDLTSAKATIIDKTVAPTQGLKQYDAYVLKEKYIKYLLEKNFDTVMEDLHYFYIKTPSSTTIASTYIEDNGEWAKCMQNVDTSDI